MDDLGVMGHVKARIVCLLVEHAGEVVTFAQFNAALWPREQRRHHANHCLRSHVHQLREQLGPAMVLTAPGVGYVWAGIDAEKPA